MTLWRAICWDAKRGQLRAMRHDFSRGKLIRLAMDEAGPGIIAILPYDDQSPVWEREPGLFFRYLKRHKTLS